MNAVRTSVALCCALGLVTAFPALALGPIDGEVSAVWWANNYDTNSETTSTSSDAGAPGLRAEMWLLERYGVRASQYAADADGSDGADYTSVDLMWRALAPAENDFVAVGLGWQQMDLAGFQQSTSGLRVSIQGSMGILDMLQAYGVGSYLPSLDDSAAADPLDGAFQDVDAFEYELGMAWKAMPFMNVHAGYRVNNVSYMQRTDLPSGSPGAFQPAGPGSGGTSTFSQGAGAGCGGCAPAALGPPDHGETEASGFFVGMGFDF